MFVVVVVVVPCIAPASAAVSADPKDGSRRGFRKIYFVTWCKWLPY